MKSTFIRLLQIVTGLLGACMFLGIVFFTIFHYGVAGSFQPFEMAIVTGLLGGFALTGGFSSNTRLVNFAYTLRRVGALYIIATIAFFLFGLLLVRLLIEFPVQHFLKRRLNSP